MIQGAGKSGMVFDAMLNIRNKGAVFLEAHPDLEVFRLRLGNALNYEFSEDMQAGLFQRPDPRSGMTSSIDALGLITNISSQAVPRWILNVVRVQRGYESAFKFNLAVQH
jgi:hypothetical protein